MKVLYHLILICAAYVLAGCSRPAPTLDEAIAALSDNWVERKTNDVVRLYGPKTTIQKSGHVIERNIFNDIWLDGVKVN